MTVHLTVHTNTNSEGINLPIATIPTQVVILDLVPLLLNINLRSYMVGLRTG